MGCQLPQYKKGQVLESRQSCCFSIMSESRLDKSPAHLKATASATGSLQYPTVRRMRNTAVLVKWIEDHQSNPYPTKAEKQYLAYYSGMNLTQLSTWFANARRRIKKIGMKTWLEGRSTFTVDFFPSPTLPTRTAMTAEYGGSSYVSNQSPYAAAYTPLTYQTQHTSPALGLQNTRLNGPSTAIYTTETTTMPPSSNGLYGTPTGRSSLINMSAFNWSMASPACTSLLPPVSMQSRQGSTAPLHSPLTAQVYSADAPHHQTLDVSDGYSLQPQHSPEQMLPECASTEPN